MKKILVFTLVTVLLAMLCSCSPQELSPDTSAETQYTFGEDYEVYVASLFETEVCLTGFTKIDSCLSHAEPPEPSKKTQTLRIDETDHVLNYVSTHDRSWNNHVYEYANAKDTVNCLYWSDTM